MLRVWLHYKPVIRTSPIYKITDFEWVPITLLLALLVITIRTLNDGVRGSQSFLKTAYLSHFSDFASLKNLSKFYFCSARQIRMRICEPYNEVSKETLNPHHLLQQGTVQFNDEEYKSLLFNQI